MLKTQIFFLPICFNYEWMKKRKDARTCCWFPFNDTQKMKEIFLLCLAVTGKIMFDLIGWFNILYIWMLFIADSFIFDNYLYIVEICKQWISYPAASLLELDVLVWMSVWAWAGPGTEWDRWWETIKANLILTLIYVPRAEWTSSPVWCNAYLHPDVQQHIVIYQ